uniref:Uncharacterized protein n=1 Tax=Rhizophora mucronata TaxID=61149 RepID=A0A2P2IVZ0_RHIMU
MMLLIELACSFAVSTNESCAAINLATVFLLDSCSSPAIKSSSNI